MQQPQHQDLAPALGVLALRLGEAAARAVQPLGKALAGMQPHARLEALDAAAQVAQARTALLDRLLELADPGLDLGERLGRIALRETAHLGDRLIQRLARIRHRLCEVGLRDRRLGLGQLRSSRSCSRCACSTRSFACVAANASRRWTSSRWRPSASAASICALSASP